MGRSATRRGFTGAAIIVAAAAFVRGPEARAGDLEGADLEGELARIEQASDGRLGVSIRDARSGRVVGHRSQERFPMCSTFKLLACGAVLARVDAGREDLGRRIRFTADEVVPYSPITKDRVGSAGMTLGELCAAALTYSDNTAGNLILASLGGPSSVTGYARTLGDPVTRLDRIETALNEATPGDPRDTTTPEAMTADLQALLAGTALSPASRDQLTRWMEANTTGAAKLRAGVPANWRVGDKTGGGDFGTTNDVAALWPPGRPPLFVAVLLTETAKPLETCNAAIAAVGRAIALRAG